MSALTPLTHGQTLPLRNRDSTVLVLCLAKPCPAPTHSIPAGCRHLPLTSFPEIVSASPWAGAGRHARLQRTVTSTPELGCPYYVPKVSKCIFLAQSLFPACLSSLPAKAWHNRAGLGCCCCLLQGPRTAAGTGNPSTALKQGWLGRDSDDCGMIEEKKTIQKPHQAGFKHWQICKIQPR